jgi:hypothetical protein
MGVVVDPQVKEGSSFTFQLHATSEYLQYTETRDATLSMPHFTFVPSEPKPKPSCKFIVKQVDNRSFRLVVSTVHGERFLGMAASSVYQRGLVATCVDDLAECTALSVQIANETNAIRLIVGQDHLCSVSIGNVDVLVTHSGEGCTTGLFKLTKLQ